MYKKNPPNTGEKNMTQARLKEYEPIPGWKCSCCYFHFHATEKEARECCKCWECSTCGEQYEMEKSANDCCDKEAKQIHLVKFFDDCIKNKIENAEEFKLIVESLLAEKETE